MMMQMNYIYANNCRIINNKATTRKSFEYKTKIVRSAPADDSRLDTQVVAPSKYLSKFWRFLDFSLINCEIYLEMKRSNFVNK